jgi:hypothetical protein
VSLENFIDDFVAAGLKGLGMKMGLSYLNVLLVGSGFCPGFSGSLGCLKSFSGSR